MTRRHVPGVKRVAVVIGTRPEAVKLAPLVLALQADARFEPRVMVTAQHREMLDQVLDLFGIVSDHDLDVMRVGQDLATLTQRALGGLAECIEVDAPDLVAVQGDTTTTLCGALAAFYAQIPVAHLEAGLRTGDPTSPFPEETNRRLTTRLASVHLAPTEAAAANLRAEGVAPESIAVTGNTVIDALKWTVEAVREPSTPELLALDADERVVLVTAHRRESLGGGMERIGEAVARIARAQPGVRLVFPIHRNPAVREAIRPAVAGLDNVTLVEPLDYADFTWLMQRSHLILTDSGGVQEEAPTLGTPTIVLRDTTERPEAVVAGTTRLVGTDVDRIVETSLELLTDETAHRRMAEVANPFGDGRACERSLEAIAFHLGFEVEWPEDFDSGLRLDLDALDRSTRLSSVGAA